MSPRRASLAVLACSVIAAVGFVGFVDDRPDVPLEQAFLERLLPPAWNVDFAPQDSGVGLSPTYADIVRGGPDRKYVALYSRDDGFEVRLFFSEFGSPARAWYEAHIGTEDFEEVHPSLPSLEADTVTVEEAQCEADQGCGFMTYRLRYGQYLATLMAVAPVNKTLQPAFGEDYVVA